MATVRQAGSALTMATGGVVVDQNADEQDFSAYFAASYGRVRRTAYLMTGDWHRADDVAQAAFVRLARSWRSVRDRQYLDGFMRTCVFREAIDESRRPWRRESAVHSVPERQDATSVAEDVAERLAVAAVLRRLPPRQRAVLVCRFYEDLDVAQTAEVLGCSQGTVKSQTARGLDALRSAVTGEYPPGRRRSGPHGGERLVGEEMRNG
jgi:RNA polymerase sigma-70 factor (sigma-E family)